MQKWVYTFETDEEFEISEIFSKLLQGVVEEALGCKVIRSRLETSDEIYENGEWEDEDADYRIC